MRAFIFDMDGVIIDSEPLHAKIKRQTLRHYGFSVGDSDIVRYVGRTTKEFFRDAIAAVGRTDISASEMTDYKHAAYLEALQKNAEVQPVYGITELLEMLMGMDVKIGLASSASREVIEIVLARFGFRDKFDIVLSGTELPKSKPDPEIYLITAKSLAVEPEDCVVLEDSQSGIAAAKAAGMYCIAYRNPSSGPQDLSAADCVVDRINEINLSELKEII